MYLPRKFICTINRIRSGHTALNSDLYRYKITNSLLCKCGKEPDTVEHIFFACDLFNNERRIMLTSLYRLRKWDPYSIIDLLNKLDQKTLPIILKYIMSIEINI